MDNILESLSDTQLEEALAKYKGMPSVIKLLEGIKEAHKGRQAEAELALQAQAQAEQTRLDFEGKIARLVKLPQPPAGIHNVYMAWQEVEEEQGQPEEVEITQPDGKKIREMRIPRVKVNKWVVETNKGIMVGKAQVSSEGKSAKRKGKQVYCKGTNPLALVVDGSQIEPPLTTWTACIRYLNANPHLLNRNPDGSPVPIIETTASGLVDLKVAGFVGIES